MDLEKLYQECANEQVKNYYKLNMDVFKSLAMDINDLKQEMMIVIWQSLEQNKDKTFDKGINNYIGALVSKQLRGYMTKAIGQETDISLSDFGLKGLNQSDEEILQSLMVTFKESDKLRKTQLADLYYNILYKKLFIGKTDEQIADDLVKEGIIESITRHRVSDIFWKKIVRKYRVQGKGLKNLGQPVTDETNDLEQEPNDDDVAKIKTYKEGQYSQNASEVLPSFLFEDIKPHLSTREYEIIEKHFQEGKNFQQIADELSIRKQTVYIFYTRALAKLRKIVPAEV